MPRPRNGKPDSPWTKEEFYFWRHDPSKGPLPAVYNPDNPNETGWRIHFEAHITSLSDSVAPQWNENFDMGRADPKVFYGGITRNINVTFFTVAMNKDEHEEHIRNLEKLALCTHPIYKEGLGYNAPHIMYYIGYLHGGYGIITNLDYNWNFTDHVWISTSPLITEVNLTIRSLADINGKRPSTESRFWK